MAEKKAKTAQKGPGAAWFVTPARAAAPTAA